MKNNAAMEDHWTNNPRFAKAEKQEQGEPVGEMTPRRAEMFMTRFKHEEKMLGPNEQAALDYVIAMLVAKQEQGEPIAHFGSAYINENGVHVTTVLGPVAIPQDAKLYLEPQQRKPLPKKRIDELADEGCFLGNIYEITAEIEAAHSIKE